MRAKIAELGALMLARNLTDLAGGNISARVDDVICITPRYAGSRRQWKLRAHDVLVLKPDGDVGFEFEPRAKPAAKAGK